MDFDYKKYSLEQLENWIHDTISGDASPQEIYDVIKGVVDEQYHYFKHHTGRCYELLCLLNGNGKYHISGYEDFVPPWGHSDLEYSIVNKKKDKVKKWILPTELDGLTGDIFVNFPEDLLEATNLKEGDKIEWVDQGDGSYLLKKVETRSEKVSPDNMTWDQAIASGWTMTADGFWIKE